MVGSITDSMDMNLSKVQEIVKDREAWHAVVRGAAKNQTQLSDGTHTQMNEKEEAGPGDKFHNHTRRKNNKCLGQERKN